MHATCSPLTLHLNQPFRIAHGVSHSRDNVLVQLGRGRGEAACVPYRSETPEAVARYVDGLDWSKLGWSAPTEILHLAHVIRALPPGPLAARAAVDMALHDIWAQALGQPLYRCLGLDPSQIPLTSETVAQAPPREMAERVAEIQGPIVKLKLGVDLEVDVERIEAVLAAKACTLRVDANAGWSLSDAECALPRLQALGVELVEQPLAVGELEGLRHLFQLRDRPPLYVDESIESCADIVAHAGVVDGVVIKLAKAGGIAGALRQIGLARALGLRVMLSCMVESSVAVTAAAHIAPLADEVDLDGPLLIRNDPHSGLEFEHGRLRLPKRPGLGLLAKPE